MIINFLAFLQISDPKLPNIMVNDDPLDGENPRAHTANSIHVRVLLIYYHSFELGKRIYIYTVLAVICLLFSASFQQDNKRDQMFNLFSSHGQYIKMTVFDFVIQTATKSSSRPRLQGQASTVAPA